jgi:hypothetical protein
MRETEQAGGIALFNYSYRRDDNTIRFGFSRCDKTTAEEVR